MTGRVTLCGLITVVSGARVSVRALDSRHEVGMDTVVDALTTPGAGVRL